MARAVKDLRDVKRRESLHAKFSRNFGVPQFILVLLLSAGLLKADPRLQFVPVDITMLFAGLTVLCVGVSIFRRAKIPRSVFTVLALFIAILPTALWMTWNDYGSEKLSRFFTLTVLAAVAPIFIVSSVDDLRRFFNGVLFISVVMAIDAVITLFTGGTELQRLSATGSDTIALGRMAGVILLWVCILMMQRRLHTVIGATLACIMAFILISSGSRGPLLASFAIIAVVYAGFYAKNIIYAVTTLAAYLFILSLPLVLFSSYIPSSSLTRIDNSLSGKYGNSETTRVDFANIAIDQILVNPLGVGLGGFSRFASPSASEDGVRSYPHNMILEIWLEGGWIAGCILMILLGRAVISAYRLAKNHSNIEFRFLFGLLCYFLFNSFISGDLNDNRYLFAFIALSLVNYMAKPGAQAIPARRSI